MEEGLGQVLQEKQSQAKSGKIGKIEEAGGCGENDDVTQPIEDLFPLQFLEVEFG